MSGEDRPCKAFVRDKEPRDCFRTESQNGSLELETVYQIGKSLLAISTMAALNMLIDSQAQYRGSNLPWMQDRRTNLVCDRQLFERKVGQGFLRMMLSELTIGIK